MLTGYTNYTQEINATLLTCNLGYSYIISF
jgi:hypothetical protein